MNKKTMAFLKDAKLCTGASDYQIQKLLQDLGSDLPPDYIDLLRFSNGVVGMIQREGHEGSAYVDLWKAEEIIAENEGYNVAEYGPGMLLFGSNGGNAAFGIDLRSGCVSTMTYIETDFIGGMDWDNIFFRAKSLYEFFEHLTDSK